MSPGEALEKCAGGEEMETDEQNDGCIEIRWLINFQKVTTLFWCLFLAWYYEKFDSPTCMVYCAIHGSYGYCWLIKDFNFISKALKTRVSIPVVLGISFLIFLPGYWTIPWLAMRQEGEAEPWLIFASIFCFTIGIVTMMVSDCQTYFILMFRRGRLITEGMNAYTIHPNYGGEVLLYTSFCMLSRSWIAYAVCYAVFALLLTPGIYEKEQSLSKYPAWEEYRKQAWRCFPNVFAMARGSMVDDALLDKPKQMNV